MSRFKKKRSSSQPAISTASLPDIIFMLLFFFMVVTKMRDAELKLKIVTPEATELTKLERKSLVNHILIGRPIEKFQKVYGTSPRIQLDDKFATVDDIPLFLTNFRESIPENQRKLITTSLEVDKTVTMGIVQDVKTELRKQAQLKISYSAKQRTDW